MSSPEAFSCIEYPCSDSLLLAVRMLTFARRSSGKARHTSGASTRAPKGWRTFLKQRMMHASSAFVVFRQPLRRPRFFFSWPKRRTAILIAPMLVVGRPMSCGIAVYACGFTPDDAGGLR